MRQCELHIHPGSSNENKSATNHPEGSFFTDSGVDFKHRKQTVHYTTGVSLNAEQGIRPLDSMREFCECGSNSRPSHPTSLFFSMVQEHYGDQGDTVLKVLCCKLEGRWFGPSWCHWNFSLTWNPSDRTTAWGRSASNTDEYQEHFLGVKAAVA